MCADLKDKVVVVTGADGALGSAVAQACALLGARVVAIDRVKPTPSQGIEPWWPVDLIEAPLVEAAMDAIATRYARIDGLVNVAGGFRWELLEGGAIDTWDALYSLNLRTAVNACKAALPHIPSGGRIVNVGALAAIKASAGTGAYAASKAGVARLTEALAEELRIRDITVNAVLPSIIDTPANRAEMPNVDHACWVSPRALADVITFLLGPRSTAITGALIPVLGRVPS